MNADELTKREWMALANCRGADPDLFVPDEITTEIPTTIQTYCEGCPVRDLCKQYGEMTRSEGIWGGNYYGFTADDQDDTYRQMGLLHDAGMSLEDIAETLGISERMVREWRSEHKKPSKIKLRCRNGHLFTEENTYMRKSKDGKGVWRECRACKRRSGRRIYRKNALGLSA